MYFPLAISNGTLLRESSLYLSSFRNSDFLDILTFFKGIPTVCLFAGRRKDTGILISDVKMEIGDVHLGP